jgi:hypothetical protein
MEIVLPLVKAGRGAVDLVLVPSHTSKRIHLEKITILPQRAIENEQQIGSKI